jgi:hypothetical protein
MLRVAQLGDQERGSSVSNGNTEAQKETSSDEHLKIDGSALKYDGKDHDDRADEDTPSSAKTISDVWGDRKSEQRT